jgi:hypothetical protein
VTNHAIVAMIEDDIKQTRCTTCDAEHPYKGARVPRRRKKEAPDALFKEVLAGMPDPDATPVLTVPVAVVKVTQPAETESEKADDREEAVADVPAGTLNVEPGADAQPKPAAAAPAVQDESSDAENSGPSEDWPMHRPLIRAQLPRIEGQKEERRPTEFTIRQPGGRSNFRGGDARAKFRGHGGHGPGGNGNGNGAGNRAHGGQRFGGGRPSGPGRGPSGSGRGPGGPGRGGPSAGFRGGPPRQGGGKKRSR